MRKQRIHNTLLRALPNVSKEFELKRLVLERIDKIEDRIIQTNIMFILGLTFLNAVYGILFKSNIPFKNNSENNFCSLITQIIFICLLIIINGTIIYIWYKKTERYNKIKKHINNLIKNNNLKDVKDLLEESENNLNIQPLESLILIMSFLYIALYIALIVPISIFLPNNNSENITRIFYILFSIYLVILITLAYFYFLRCNLFESNNQKKFSIVYSVMITILLVLTLIKIYQPTIQILKVVCIIDTIVFLFPLVVIIFWDESFRNDIKNMLQKYI